jgi:hypothetical protein
MVGSHGVPSPTSQVPRLLASPHMVGVNQPIRWYLGGKVAIIQQGTSVWVGLPILSQHRVKVPTSEPQETMDTWSWLFYVKMLTQLVLRVGSSCSLNPTLSTSPKPYLQKVLPCRHPWDTWDLGPHVKWHVPTSMLSLAKIAWIDPKWLGT